MRPPRNSSWSNVFLEEELVATYLCSMVVVSGAAGQMVGSLPQVARHHNDGGDITEGRCTHVV
jgi:hypothetical protein